jgi:SAM-dependent methyltransferase
MADSWQVSGDAARVYERELVPALFTEWPSHLLEAAAVVPSGILDVACGTGVVLRTALARKLFVVGTDLNPTMLQVAAELGVDAAFAQSTVLVALAIVADIFGNGSAATHARHGVGVAHHGSVPRLVRGDRVLPLDRAPRKPCTRECFLAVNIAGVDNIDPLDARPNRTGSSAFTCRNVCAELSLPPRVVR